MDYADGVFQVTVPKGTDALQLLVQKTGKDCGTGLTDLLFFARWGGYFTESESKWQLCPYLLDGDTALYSAAQVSGVGVYPLQLQDGTPALVSGVTQLKDGAMQLSEGLQQFNRDGIQKLVNLLQNDVGDLSARVQATIDVSKDYRNFAGISDDAEGQVKFIYRTDEIA